jgi:hypothetical protein
MKNRLPGMIQAGLAALAAFGMAYYVAAYAVTPQAISPWTDRDVRAFQVYCALVAGSDSPSIGYGSRNMEMAYARADAFEKYRIAHDPGRPAAEAAARKRAREERLLRGNLPAEAGTP